MANIGHMDSGLEVVPNNPNPQNLAAQNQYYGDQKQQSSVYQNEVPQQPWPGPPPPATYPQPQPVQYQQNPHGTGPSRICGMRKKVFWIVFAVSLVVIIGVGVGAGVGVALSKRSKGYKPYSLVTGAWNIQSLPPNSADGVCYNTDPGAVVGCPDLNFQFVVNQNGDGYSIANSPIGSLNGPLEPPKSEDDMWVKSSTSTEQVIGVTANCQIYVNTTIKLGKALQFQIFDQGLIRQSCTLNNGLISTPNQECDCLWFGFLIPYSY